MRVLLLSSFFTLAAGVLLENAGKEAPLQSDVQEVQLERVKRGLSESGGPYGAFGVAPAEQIFSPYEAAQHRVVRGAKTTAKPKGKATTKKGKGGGKTTAKAKGGKGKTTKGGKAKATAKPKGSKKPKGKVTSKPEGATEYTTVMYDTTPNS